MLAYVLVCVQRLPAYDVGMRSCNVRMFVYAHMFQISACIWCPDCNIYMYAVLLACVHPCDICMRACMH